MSGDQPTQRRIARALTPARTVPPFGSDAEEADWYSKHDTYHVPTYPVIDPEDSEVTPGFGFVAVRLFRKELEEIERRAATLEIDSATYLRLLINHHLFEEPPMLAGAQQQGNETGEPNDLVDVSFVQRAPHNSREIYDMLARFVLKSQPPEPEETPDEPEDIPAASAKIAATMHVADGEPD